MDFMQDMFGGGDPELYHDPHQQQINQGINELETSNFGAQAAQNSERAIGRRYQDRMDQIQGDPNFGRNAAVSAKLTDMAQSEAGNSTANAYTQGAAEDAHSRAQGAQMGLQAGQLDMQINNENYQREQSTRFGNSFVGGLLENGVSAAVGGLEGGVLANMMGGKKKKKPGEEGEDDAEESADNSTPVDSDSLSGAV